MKNFSLRLPEIQRDRLVALATQVKLQPADLIRASVEALLINAEENGGRITLPVRFESISSEIEKGGRVFERLDAETLDDLIERIKNGGTFAEYAREVLGDKIPLSDYRLAWIFAVAQSDKHVLQSSPNTEPAAKSMDDRLDALSQGVRESGSLRERINTKPSKKTA